MKNKYAFYLTETPNKAFTQMNDDLYEWLNSYKNSLQQLTIGKNSDVLLGLGSSTLGAVEQKLKAQIQSMHTDVGNGYDSSLPDDSVGNSPGPDLPDNAAIPDMPVPSTPVNQNSDLPFPFLPRRAHTATQDPFANNNKIA